MHFFLILQLWLAPFFNISSLSDLKYNLHKYREKSDFFGKISDFFRKIGDFCRFFSDFFAEDFSTRKSFPPPPKTDFSPKNRPKKSIFLSLVKRRGGGGGGGGGGLWFFVSLFDRTCVNEVNPHFFPFFFFVSLFDRTCVNEVFLILCNK